MSGKTIAQKLVMKPGNRIWVSSADVLDVIGPLPEDVTTVDDIALAQVAVLFVADAAATRAALDAQRAGVTQPATIWIAYPKGNRSDINRDSLWPIAVEYGLRPNGQVAIDDTWSALRFRAQKPGEELFTGGAKRD